MNKIDNFCNTLQKLRVSNPNKNTILSHLHAISKALDDLSKKYDNFVLLGDFNNGPEEKNVKFPKHHLKNIVK